MHLKVLSKTSREHLYWECHFIIANHRMLLPLHTFHLLTIGWIKGHHKRDSPSGSTLSLNAYLLYQHYFDFSKQLLMIKKNIFFRFMIIYSIILIHYILINSSSLFVTFGHLASVNNSKMQYFMKLLKDKGFINVILMYDGLYLP